MKKIISFSFAIFIMACLGPRAFAQQTAEVKRYAEGLNAGAWRILSERAESDGRQTSVVYSIQVLLPGAYDLQFMLNQQQADILTVTADRKIVGTLRATQSGWRRSGLPGKIFLAAGTHELRFTRPGNMMPAVDAISGSQNGEHTLLESSWQSFSARMNKWIAEKQEANTAAGKTTAETTKTLPNPDGSYDHAIDTPFTYSSCLLVYLTAGQTYTFTTYGSTKDPVMYLFDAANVDSRSWYNDDMGGGSTESSITVTIPVTAYYNLLVRPYTGTASGFTNIKQNNVTIITNAVLGGLLLGTTPRTGSLNYFTTRLSGSSPDTRICTFATSNTQLTCYNDDYTNTSGGDWYWGRASRVKKNFTTGNNSVYVCAFHYFNEGRCDVYMGNGNAGLPGATFGPTSYPYLKAEDAIQASAYNGTYNCISWSGGITTSWSWPPSNYSTWNVPGNDLAGFDKFYANNPKRFPGAWNYTRTGANSTNSVVDLWALSNGWYTHASVTRPGNNNPHGYDWESKPGEWDRTFHPRNALSGPAYGAVVNYYIATGTYARGTDVTQNFETDADAIKAGVAVYEPAVLSPMAKDKLNRLTASVSKTVVDRFESLYSNWKNTWVENAAFSDPDAYCRNGAFEELNGYCRKQGDRALVFVFAKFVNGDHYIGKILWEMTSQRYAKLLQEAKNEYLNNPYDESGRFRINGDHDNGVRYVEKILKVFELPAAAITATYTISASPNPVQQELSVTLTLQQNSRAEVKAVSAQTRKVKLLRAETMLPAGVHRFTTPIKEFAGGNGDVLNVQVMVNGEIQMIKVLVVR